MTAFIGLSDNAAGGTSVCTRCVNTIDGVLRCVRSSFSLKEGPHSVVSMHDSMHEVGECDGDSGELLHSDAEVGDVDGEDDDD